MIENELSTEAAQKYETAYEAQYTTRDIQKALTLYEDIIISHPDTKEAGYSRSQVQNIVNTVVPKKTVMDSLLVLVRIHFEKNAPLDAEPVSV